MSSVHFHPEDDMLRDYHRGALAAGQRLVVRAHLDMCVHCRNELKLMDVIGGAMLASIEGVAVAYNALDLALARIERPAEPVAKAAPSLRRPKFLKGFDLPPSLEGVAIKDRYFVAPGVWLAPVEVEDPAPGSKTYFMYVKAGMAMPPHAHRGREMTLMFQGQYRDHKGLYARGDMATCDDSDDRHSPAMEGDVDCLCLVSQEAAIVPQTMLGWLLKPIARI